MQSFIQLLADHWIVSLAFFMVAAAAFILFVRQNEGRLGEILHVAFFAEMFRKWGWWRRVFTGMLVLVIGYLLTVSVLRLSAHSGTAAPSDRPVSDIKAATPAEVVQNTTEAFSYTAAFFTPGFLGWLGFLGLLISIVGGIGLWRYFKRKPEEREALKDAALKTFWTYWNWRWVTWTIVVLIVLTLMYAIIPIVVYAAGLSEQRSNNPLDINVSSGLRLILLLVSLKLSTRIQSNELGALFVFFVPITTFPAGYIPAFPGAYVRKVSSTPITLDLGAVQPQTVTDKDGEAVKVTNHLEFKSDLPKSGTIVKDEEPIRVSFVDNSTTKTELVNKRWTEKDPIEEKYLFKLSTEQLKEMFGKSPYGRAQTASVNIGVPLEVKDAIRFFSKFGGINVSNPIEEVYPRVVAAVEAAVNAIIPKYSLAVFLAHKDLFDLAFLQYVEESLGDSDTVKEGNGLVDSIGIDIKAVVLTKIDLSHRFNITLTENASAVSRAKDIVTTAIANKRRVILEGKGRADASRAEAEVYADEKVGEGARFARKVQAAVQMKVAEANGKKTVNINTGDGGGVGNPFGVLAALGLDKMTEDAGPAEKQDGTKDGPPQKDKKTKKG